MSEIDRERILAERYEQRQRIADRRAARREKKVCNFFWKCDFFFMFNV